MVEEKKQDLNSVCVCVSVGDGLQLYTSLARCASVLILLLSMTVVWELLKGDRSGWRARSAGLQGAAKGNMLGPQPEEGARIRSGEDHQCKSGLNTDKQWSYSFFTRASRCSIQQGRGPL